MNKKMIAVIVGASLTVGVFGLGAGGAFASDKVGATGKVVAEAAPQPPKGVRAVVQISPNPAKPGEELTITGHCGGGEKLKEVFDTSKLGEAKPILKKEIKPLLKNIRIIDDNPKGFTAKATLTTEIGNGVGPVFVECGGKGGHEAGVTLLLTQVSRTGS
ncbi:hypothetical protein [Streptosporangium sp. NPDC001681]|uniref:hypothetical protein n=1 Tax=Streptosporangium sp. NPDC001681 TaxID=3154395 RepID=UPI0033173227